MAGHADAAEPMEKFLAFHCCFPGKDGNYCGKQLEEGVVAPCYHVFCPEHTKEWFDGHDDCPVCRDGAVRLIRTDFSRAAMRRRRKMLLVGASPTEMVQALDTALNLWISQKCYEQARQGKTLDNLRQIHARMEERLQSELRNIEQGCTEVQAEQQRLEQRLEEVRQECGRIREQLPRAKRELAEVEERYMELRQQLGAEPRTEEGTFFGPPRSTDRGWVPEPSARRPAEALEVREAFSGPPSGRHSLERPSLGHGVGVGGMPSRSVANGTRGFTGGPAPARTGAAAATFATGGAAPRGDAGSFNLANAGRSGPASLAPRSSAAAQIPARLAASTPSFFGGGRVTKRRIT